MTVNTTSNTSNFTGDGTQTAFTYDFAIQQSADMDVYLDGVLQSSGYVVAVNASGVGGTVTFASAPANAVVGILQRVVEYTQGLDLPTEGNLPEVAIENAFDKITMMCQQLEEKAARALSIALGTTGVGTTLPTAESLKLLRWNLAATALENTDPVGDVNGPATSTTYGIALWANSAGTDLLDGPGPATSGYPLLAQGAGAPAYGQLNLAGVGVTGVLAKANQNAATAYTDAANSWSITQIPGAANTFDIGSTALPFRNLYLGTANVGTKLVSAASGAERTVTFPDANSNTVQPIAAVASNWLRSCSSAGLFTASQPAFTDVSGTTTKAQQHASTAYIDAANSWSTAQTPNAANAIDIGSTALPFRNLFLGAATNNTKFVSAASGAQRTVTFPDADSNTVQPSGAVANQFLTAISSAGVISRAAIAAGDLPNHSAALITSGTLAIAQGGTNNGALSVTAGKLPFFDGTKMDSLAMGASQSIRWNAAGNAFEAFTPSSGSVSGPGTSTDRTVPLFSGAGGATLKDGPALNASGIFFSFGSAADPAFRPYWSPAPGHRLTTESGQPLSTTARTAQGTIYLTPYFHNRAWLKYNDGTQNVWRPYEIDEISIALTATSGTPYAVYLYATSATAAALELQAWTNTTTRATAIAVDADTGMPIKSGDASRVHVGDFYATGTNQTSDAASSRSLQNVFNQVMRELTCTLTGTTHTYNSTTVRAPGGNSTVGQGRFEVMVSKAQPISIVAVLSSIPTSTGHAITGVGVNSTTVDSAVANACGGGSSVATDSVTASSAEYAGSPAIGYNYFSQLESISDTAVTTVNESNGIGKKSGMRGLWAC